MNHKANQIAEPPHAKLFPNHFDTTLELRSMAAEVEFRVFFGSSEWDVINQRYYYDGMDSEVEIIEDPSGRWKPGERVDLTDVALLCWVPGESGKETHEQAVDNWLDAEFIRAERKSLEGMA